MYPDPVAGAVVTGAVVTGVVVTGVVVTGVVVAGGVVVVAAALSLDDVADDESVCPELLPLPGEVATCVSVGCVTGGATTGVDVVGSVVVDGELDADGLTLAPVSV